MLTLVRGGAGDGERQSAIYLRRCFWVAGRIVVVRDIGVGDIWMVDGGTVGRAGRYKWHLECCRGKKDGGEGAGAWCLVLGVRRSATQLEVSAPVLIDFGRLGGTATVLSASTPYEYKS